MRKRRSTGHKSTPPRSTPRHSPATRSAPAATRQRRDPFAREYVPLPAEARALGFDWRTIRKHIADEPFVRVLGERWYVRHAEFLAWWERQRPRTKAVGSGR